MDVDNALQLTRINTQNAQLGPSTVLRKGNGQFSCEIPVTLHDPHPTLQPSPVSGRKHGQALCVEANQITQ
jgi:hypothetical protein